MLKSLVRNFYLLITLLSAVAKAALLTNGVCVNPQHEKGICIQIKDCIYFMDLLRTSNNDLSPENLKFLRDSECDRDGSQDAPSKRIFVCCPDRFRRTNTSSNTTSNTSMNPGTAGNVLPPPGECGKILSNRILGGNVTDIDEFPWMALLRYKTGPDNYGFFCGGSLINTRYVLTAGHCLKHPDMPPTWELYSVRLGEWDLDLDPDCTVDSRGRKECIESYKDYLIDYAITHPGYVPTSKDQFNDIALIRLLDPVIFMPHIIPICLPRAQNIRTKLFTSQAMDVAGWGVTENGTTSSVKLKIMVNVWEIARCQNTYKTFQLPINSDYQMCAGGVDGIDTCRGDSGGPLMVTETVDKHFVYFAAGVVSYGPRPCGLDGWPGVYTRVGTFTDWIVDNLLP